MINKDVFHIRLNNMVLQAEQIMDPSLKTCSVAIISSEDPNGSVIALAGDSPAQAAWSLSLWNGLLLFSIAKWGVSLNSKYFAILSTCFVAISPALAQLRVDYVLEMPLTACISLSIWMTGVWLDPIKGGKWWQALLAALSTTCSLLIKQSSLLIIFPCGKD